MMMVTTATMIPDIYTYIGDFLDHKGLAKLMRVSKEAHACIRKRFIALSHPHALAHIAQAILNRRLNTPAHSFGFHTRTGNMLHYVNESPRNAHTMMTLFEVNVRHSNTVEVNTMYTLVTKGRCVFTGGLTATLTPSLMHPMREGSARIIKSNCDSTETVSFDYTNHLDAIEWCPLQQPPTMTKK